MCYCSVLHDPLEDALTVMNDVIAFLTRKPRTTASRLNATLGSIRSLHLVRKCFEPGLEGLEPLDVARAGQPRVVIEAALVEVLR